MLELLRDSYEAQYEIVFLNRLYTPFLATVLSLSSQENKGLNVT